VNARLSSHVRAHELLPVFHAVSLLAVPLHRTPVIRVVNSMLIAMDQGHVGALMLLDLSAVFTMSIITYTDRRCFISVRRYVVDWLADLIHGGPKRY